MTLRLRAALPITALVLAALAACSAPSGTPPPSGAACAVADATNTVQLTAKDLKFSAPCIDAMAGMPIIINFTNLESVPHNLTVWTDTSRTTQIVAGDTIQGPDKTTTVTVPAQPPGQLFFDCTIHPNAMNGALVVKAVPGASAS